MHVAQITVRDFEHLSAVGISAEEAAWQYGVLRDVPRPAVLSRPCLVGDGIMRIDRALAERYQAIAEEAARENRLMKFVPASGAATRMFRDLDQALEDSGPASDPVRRLIEHRDEFAFRERLGVLCGDSSWADQWRDVVRFLLKADGLGYESLPKGLVLFHHYPSGPRTAFEEQLREGVACVRSLDHVCRFHFTIAGQWRHAFSAELERIRSGLEKEWDCVLDVTFSEQHSSTDTMAVDRTGEPFRLPDGRLLLRPGGHGALLRNLEETSGDIVIAKNIDNIVREERFEQITYWKRVLIGHLVHLQREAFALVRRCRAGADRREADAALRFASEHFGRGSDSSEISDDQARLQAIEALDRPMRVCGVVRNDGEPGGAPFWVASENETPSLQIVESSQVGLDDPDQKRIWRSSTHFNPVDLVCGLRSSEGHSFELDRFVDRNAVFVSEKSFGCQTLRALERPGLWNGSMAGWNTVFVEVPAETFAPVKTVFDLLRPAHQPER